MPLYEYQCTNANCARIYEFIVRDDTGMTVECSKCGYVATKIISLSSFHLKGSGWSKDSYQKRYNSLDAFKQNKDKP